MRLVKCKSISSYVNKGKRTFKRVAKMRRIVDWGILQIITIIVLVRVRVKETGRGELKSRLF